MPDRKLHSEEPRREPTGSEARKPSAGGASAKPTPGGKSGVAKRAERQDGMEGGGNVGARPGGFEGFEEKQKPRGLVEPFTDSPANPQGQELLTRESLPGVVPESPKEREAVGRDAPFAERSFPRDRAQLRAAVMERLLRGMVDIQGRLARFLTMEIPSQTGVLSLSLVLSESSVTYELWKASMASPGNRDRLSQTLGLPSSVDDRSLVRALMDEVHQGFVDFQASRQGRESRRQYEEVLQRYEEADVLFVTAGHDPGPMVAELARMGVPHAKDFTRSLLLDPRVLAVGITLDEGSATQVMVIGLTAPQLGPVIAQVRRLNPRLTNQQVRYLLFRVSLEPRSASRKRIGQAEVNRAQELARQLLRLQAVEQLYP
jgi:hypothetical protein